MGTPPRNRKTKSPRPIASEHLVERHATRRVYPAPASSSPSPTPPPVTVARTSNRGLASPPTAEPPIEAQADRATSRWAWLSLTCLTLFASAVAFRALHASQWVAPMMNLAAGRLDTAPPAPTPERAPTAVVTSRAASRWHVRHDGYASISGGVLLTPESFVSSNGEYDLVIHFHGDVGIVRESFEHAQINAAVAVINLGVSSGAYRQAFAVPGAFEALLTQIQHALRRRGFGHPKLQRLALTAWSAGAGAIKSILENRAAPRAEIDPLDAIIVLDGVHAGFVDGDPTRLNPRSVESFVEAARAAAADNILLSITHSQIDPVRYGSTERTAAFILEQLGAHPGDSAVLPLPEHIVLDAARHAVKKHKRLVPIADTRLGSLHVQGFKGNTADDHAAHLTQMAVVVLPELAARWQQPERTASTR